MHGGREGEDRKRRQHMWPVPSSGTATAVATPTTPVAALGSNSLHSASDSFLKDGRKIRVGDCALFQAGNAPPFIGIIRCFATSKEDYLKLCVNWLYRPADVKLAKGALLEAAPNEVFYSFHKDVIPAASLLHPCKVAFLRKGVELPSGISSFVCRRVYDIENRCLWWLTDQDYINERQEEVDQLIEKTRLEMHAAVQSGGRSPKPLNGPASTQQLKSGPDSVQNNGNSFPSQGKGKKRDRGDQCAEPIKRERSTKQEEGDSVSFRIDSMIKAEIAKITDKGGLMSTEGVEKLVHLMQIDRAERKLDVAGRVLLADVIAATDRFDCLNRFVQLRGVTVLDEWLQEAHKGKAGDGSSPKEGDKAVEELLLALLRALDKLPVNLNALQTCNIGKSVNHLRSHKNVEILKKAKSLVDTWKKRVDAEIKINDAKSVGSSQAVSWPGKPGFPEVSHAGNRRAGSTDVTMKSSITQPSACRSLPGKPGHADAIVKSTPVTPGSLKLPSSLPASVAISSKDSLSKVAGPSGTSELAQMGVKEEKSSSSSQSPNNSQSCSSDHAKMMGSSWKEDARSSTTGSMSAGKSSSGSSRYRRSNNGLIGTSISGAHKETNLGKSGSVSRTTTLEKVSLGGSMSERPLDMPVADHRNNRLIVRLPNPGRSPAQSVGGGSLEDPSVTGSRASSPGAPDKHDNSDAKLKGRDRSHIAADVNTESWQSNDVKEGLVGSDEGDRSPAVVLDGERSRTADETEKAADISRATCSSSGTEKVGLENEHKMRNSFSSMNALIESCAKYSETSAPLSAGDDIGMNLLASVAAGEMSKSGLVSPTGSPGSSPVTEDPCTGNNEAKSRLSFDNGRTQSHGPSDENADVDSEKHEKTSELHEVGADFSGDNKTGVALQESKSTGEQTGQHHVSSVNCHITADSCIKSEGKLEDRADRCFPVCTPADMKEELGCDGAFQHQDKRKTGEPVVDSLMDCKPMAKSPSTDENKSVDCSREKVAEDGKCASDFICSSVGDGGHDHSAAFATKSQKSVISGLPSRPLDNESLSGAPLTEQQLSAVVENHVETLVRRGSDAGASSVADKVFCSENAADSKTRISDSFQVGHLEHGDSENKELTGLAHSNVDVRPGSVLASVATTAGVPEILERKEALENHRDGSGDCGSSPTLAAPEADKCTKPTVSNLSGVEADGRDELTSSAEAPSLVVVATEQEIAARPDFDLNEGIPGDDGNPSEQATSAALVCSSAVRLPSLSPFACSSISNGSPAPITVAAPAKGPFFPPENLMKIKAEPGWKGSAATSAFRPAEPRKVPEMPLATPDAPSSDAVAGKHGRPALDIDLNVPGERVLEDMASQNSTQATGSELGVVSNRDAPARSAGGLDLDLNRVDDENGHFLASAGRRLDVPLLPVRPTFGGFSSGEANILRDFDLNNGPALDEVGLESLPRSQHAKSNTNVPFLPPVVGLRMNNAEFGSPWFPPGNTYPAIAIPSFLPDRGEHPYPIVAAAGTHRILGQVTGAGTYGGDIYRGPVLSSSPAMPFAPATAFPYGGFPFGSSFPVASTSFSGVSTTYVDTSSAGGSCFPAIPSQFVGPAGHGSSHYPRPYMLSLPEGSTNTGGSESSRKWGRQGLDLNAGPGGGDMELKDDRLSSASRQLSVAGSHSFVEEQARIAGGSGLKRKEPEGVRDAERFAYKQHSWH